ncbi:hypothetical protein ACE6H2_019016 [Prunus campanulata]
MKSMCVCLAIFHTYLVTGYSKDKCTRWGHRAVRPIGVTCWVQFVKDNQDMKSISGQDKAETKEVGLV